MDIRASAFVGRLQQLGGLVEDLHRACSGAGAVRFISVEPGIGKTRLADELAHQAKRRGCTVLRGWAAEHEHDRPFGVVLDAFRSGSPALFDAARSAVAAPSDHGAVDELVDVVESATSHGSLLLVFEGLHWADPLSVRLLLSIGVRASTVPLLVVATMRSVPQSPSLCASGVEAGRSWCAARWARRLGRR